MKKLKYGFCVLIFFAVLISGVAAKSNPDYNAIITGVINGHTIEVLFVKTPPDGCNPREKIKLIGVNTVEPFNNLSKFNAEKAKDFMKHYIKHHVKVTFDDNTPLRDNDGDILAYVYLSDDKNILLNEALISNGYGFFYTPYGFNPGYMRRFENAQIRAKKRSLGFWKETPRDKEPPKPPIAPPPPQNEIHP